MARGGSETQLVIVLNVPSKICTVTLRQIDQSRFLLETYSQKGAVSKLFPEGLYFWRELANGVGELDTWQHLVELASGDGETLSTWRVPPFVMAKCFFYEFFFKT